MAGKQFKLSTIFEVINQATGPLRSIGGAFRKLGRTVEKTGRKLRSFGETVRKVGRKAGGFLGARFMGAGKIGTTFLGAGLAAFAKTALDTTVSFQESMNKVRAITGVTGKTFLKMEAQAKELGATTQFTARQSADAMTFLGMAGLNANQIMEAMPGTLQLAAAGAIDLATAADIATNVMTSMGFEASQLGHINDVLAKTATSANTNILQLAEAMRPVAPFASAAGVSLEEMSAMLGKMADAGERGSIAGTLLRNAFEALLKGGKKMNSFMGELGVSVSDFTDSQGKIKDFDLLMKRIAKSGIAPAKIMKAFGQRGGRAILELTKRGKDLTEFTRTLENSTGTAKKMQEIMMTGLPGATKELASAWEGLQLAITEGNVGKIIEEAVRDLAGALRVMSTYSASEIFGSWGDALKSLGRDILETLYPMMKIGRIMREGEEAEYGKEIQRKVEEEKGVESLFGEYYKMTKQGVMGGDIARAIAKEEQEVKVTIDVRGKEGATAVLGEPIRKKGKANVKINTINAGQILGSPATP